MIYRFPVECTQKPSLYHQLLLEQIEAVLLLGYFLEGSRAVWPTEARLAIGAAAEKRQPLFDDIEPHLWCRTSNTTTKEELRTRRLSGEANTYYDIDVLRKTEPRILFIRRSLSAINRLPHPERSQCLSLFQDERSNGQAGRRRLQVVFAGYLSDLLGEIKLFAGGRRVTPTSFCFLRYPETTETPLNLSDPTGSGPLGNFSSHFSSIVDVGIQNGCITEFSLSSYEDWLEPSNGEPFEVLGVLSRDCNARCDFCYVLGNPSNTAVKLPAFGGKKSRLEAETRLTYFRQGQRLPIPTYDTEEIVTHPYFFDTCEAIRLASSKCISITTNGYRLDEATLLRLKSLAPIDISLSLNAVKPMVRAWLMGGGYEKGLASLALMDDLEIPCAVTLVAWPRVPLSELVDGIRYASQFNVRSISILLGGFTRLFPNPPKYPIPAYWNDVIDCIRPMRPSLPVPLILQPRLYEESYASEFRLGASVVTGLNRFSPAGVSGLAVYDEILAIEGSPVVTRNQSLSMLASARERSQSIALILRRNGREMSVQLEPGAADSRYLYGPPFFNDRYGIHLYGDDLRLRSIREIFSLIEEYGAKKVVFLTSMIVRPFLERSLLRFGPLFAEYRCELYLEVPPNRFLGGNIVMGDMLVLDDLIDFIEDYLSRGEQPDLILVPSGPFNYGGWLRDMRGHPFELLKRSFRVPIELIRAPYFE